MEVSKRLKLAYISPMPPLKTGIADYSAELIPFLSEYYDITVIVNQGEVSDNWAKLNCDIRQSKWFEENLDRLTALFIILATHLFMNTCLICLKNTRRCSFA